MTPPPPESCKRLVKVLLDEDSIGPGNRDVEHERAVAIYDLVEENSFAPEGHDGGPYCLRLQVLGNRLIFDIRTEDDRPVVAHHLSLSPFRRLVKDYFLVCESYYQAIRTATPSQIEAIDMVGAAFTTKAPSCLWSGSSTRSSSTSIPRGGCSH
jgi:uncharacterized protein (UPF0262 family)